MTILKDIATYAYRGSGKYIFLMCVILSIFAKVVGITLIMAENLRSGMVWETFMRAPEVQRGMQLAGFSPVMAGPTAVTLAAQ